MATTTKRGLNKPDRTSLVNVITAINNNMDNLDDAVPDSRKVNGKALSSDITIDDSDLPIIAGKIASTQAMIAPPFVEATPNEAGTFVTNAGALYYLPNGHTANTTWENTTKTAVDIDTVIAALKESIADKQDPLTFDSIPTQNSTNPVTSGGVYSAIKAVEVEDSALPKIADSDAENVDLDVTDNNGNVIVRFADGHIEVKEFDSRDVGDLGDLETTDKTSLVDAINEVNGAVDDKVDMPTGGTAGQVLGLDSNLDPAWINQSGGGGSGNVDAMDSEATGIDLDISDMNGNVLMRLENGNIRTKKFNSDNGVYESQFAYTSTAGTETITHFFPAGTRLLFHLINAASHADDTIASQTVTYKYTDTSNVAHTICTDYGYNYPVFTLPVDAVSVSVTYPNNLTWGANATLSFKVYSVGDIPRQPIVLEVGTGKQYTNLRTALEYASARADAIIRYEVHLFPGTYDTIGYYTAEEIAVEGFQGLFVTNGVSLIGIGQRSEIVLTATMSTTDYTTQKRNDISTLNVVGNMTVKNMTIIAENIRYALHDDTGVMGHQLNEHIYEDVTFIGENLTSSADGERSFGAGGGNMKRMIMRNCDFSDNMVIHTSTNNVHDFTVYLENCRSRLMNFADYDSGHDAWFYLNNCTVSKIYFGRSGSHDQYLHLEGTGTDGAMIFCPSGYVYALGGVHKFIGASVTAGKAVKLNSAMTTVAVADSLDSVYGICIGVLDGITYVQAEGWVNSNTLGLSNLSVGDYLTVNTSTGAVEVGTSANAIAQVRHVDSDGIAYAKLM